MHLVIKKYIWDLINAGWIKLYSGVLHNLYSSTNIIRVIVSWRVRWAMRVVRMGEVNTIQNFMEKYAYFEDRTYYRSRSK